MTIKTQSIAKILGKHTIIRIKVAKYWHQFYSLLIKWGAMGNQLQQPHIFLKLRRYELIGNCLIKNTNVCIQIVKYCWGLKYFT